MNDKPKSIWKKSWKGWSGFFLFNLITAGALFAAIFSIAWFTDKEGALPLAFAFALAGVLVVWFVNFIRWLCCWKNFRRFLFACACLVTLIALAYAEEDWRGKHDWEKFKGEWEAKGEKFDFTSVIPPPVPDDQNFALAPIWVESMKAVLGPTNSLQWFGSYAEDGRTNFVDRLDMSLVADYADWPTNGAGNWQLSAVTDLKPWQDYYRSLATRTNLFPVAPHQQTPAQDVLLALSKYDSPIEELREASQRPYSRFPLYYDLERPYETLLPHLADEKRCSQALQLRAVAELQNGQSDKALADVKLMLYLVNSIRSEPFLISHLVRIAMLQITLQPVYEGLAEHKWSDPQLAELDSELSKLDLLTDYELSMRGERACSLTSIEYIRRNIRNFIETIGDFGDHRFAEQAVIFGYYLIPAGWFHQTEMHIGRFYQNWYLPLANVKDRTMSPKALRATDDALTLELRNRYAGSFLERMFLAALGAAAKKYAWAQESTDLARVAIALERYRLAHGQYPESLDASVPQFMTPIPHDIINGEPLHYRRTADGKFVLYSVGWNETDDGRVVVFSKGSSDRVDINQGDWVWRYPQK